MEKKECKENGMIEKVYSFFTGDEMNIDRIVEDCGVRINKLTLPAGGGAPAHPTPDDAHMIVARGTLTIALADQEAHSYEEGKIIRIPGGTMMQISNKGDSTLHLFIIKAQ